MSANEIFEHHYADLDAVRLHYVTAGRGEPVVLLHGWPQSWYEWRALMSELAEEYFLIAPDLRGLGDSSRPASGYDTATVANDIWQLVHRELHHDRFRLVGHDWGGPVAYALAATHRDAVSQLAILDVAIPGDGSANISQGGKRWHHAFHQTAMLPEALIAGREAIYLGWFYRTFGARPDAICEEAVAEYLRTYSQAAALHAGFEYYRNIPTDVAQNEAHVAAGKLSMPVLALGGAKGWGRGDEVLASCRRIASDVRGGVIADAGHWLPEEQPQEVAHALREFFKESAIDSS